MNNYVFLFSLKLLGIGDWGLGIGPNPQNPKPQPPNPKPQTPKKNFFKKLLFLKKKINN